MSTNWLSQIKDTQSTPVTWDIAEGVDTRIFRATSSTAAATAAKVATLDVDTGFALNAGVRVAVTFQYGNSATTPTLNVNSKGAKNIVTATGSAATTAGNGGIYNNWGPYETVLFTYNGASWIKGATGLSLFTHTHGNITGDGKLQTNDIVIASGDKIVVTDADNNNRIARTNITFDGSTTTKALTPKGTWENVLNSLPTASSSTLGGVKIGDGITISNGVISVTASNLGLSNAMHFIGKATVAITDGSTTNPTITGYDFTNDRKPGDVIIDNDTNDEFVWTSEGKWERLGPDNSYKVLQTAITDSTGTEETTEATRFIYSFSQDANGVVSVKTRPLPTYNNYSLPLAADGTRGGIQIGYSTSGKNYAVQLSSEKAYVNVPWTDTLVKQTAKTDNVNYKILFTTSASPSSGSAAETGYDTDITINPSTNTITATNFAGNASTATAIETAGTTAQFYRGDNIWSNILKQTANSTLGIDSNLKIGTAKKDLHIEVANGSGTGINDGYAGGITFGDSSSAYAGIYYQTSSGYGSRLHFATTGSYADGAYTRMIIAPDGKVGIGLLTPTYTLHVNGTTGLQGGHLYLTGSSASSSTGNTTQIVFGTSSTQHIALSSNSGALVINPSTSSTTGQIIFRPGSTSCITSGQLTINATGQPDYNLYVNGTSYFTGNATHKGNILVDEDDKRIIGDNDARFQRLYTISGYFGNVNDSSGGVYLYTDHTTYGRFYINRLGTANTPETSAGAGDGVAGTYGRVYLALGNSTAVNTATNASEATGANNARGILRLYGTGTAYTDINTSSTYNHAFVLQNYDADMYAVHAGNANAVGSAKKPVYVAANGRITVSNGTVGSSTQPMYLDAGEMKACTAYTGLLTDFSSSENTLSITIGGTTETASAVNSVSNTWTDGTTAGPTLSTTVNGVSGTAVAIPSATDSVSGVVTTNTQTFAGSKHFTESVYIDSTGKGLLLVDKENHAYPAIYDNGTNLWIGADQSDSNSTYHHYGGLFFDAGLNNATDKYFNTSIYLKVGTSATDTTGTTVPIAYGSGGSSTKPVFVNDAGKVTACNYSVSATVNSGASNRAAYYSGANAISQASNIYMDTGSIQLLNEGVYYAKMPRKLEGGGGWNYRPFNFIDNSNSTYASIGTYGNANSLTYIYMGANNYDGNNLRVYPTGVISSMASGNEVKIGSQNASYTHIYNSTNIPFMFNNSVLTTTGSLGNASYPWNNLYIGKANGAGIWYQGTKSAYKMITFIDNATDTYGNGIAIGGGGQTIIGGGESTAALIGQAGTAGAEIMWVGNDSEIAFYPGQQDGYDASAKITMTASRLWTGVSGNTTREAQLGTQAGAGKIYMWSSAATTGTRGLWLNSASGASHTLLTVNQSNQISGIADFTSTGQMVRAGSSVSWFQGRANAFLRISSYSGYNAIYSMKTTNGDWSCGVYSSNCLYWSYTTDTNYNNSTNTVTQMYLNASGYLYPVRCYNAVWNDYAEFRHTDQEIEPGRTVIDTDNGTMILATKRLQAGAKIISDTYGTAMGETDKCKTPIAVSGRVLVYPAEERNSYHAGDCVCTGPNGTVSKMSRNEIVMWPDRIIGTVSEIPNYEEWGTGKVKVDGRIWIYVR